VTAADPGAQPVPRLVFGLGNPGAEYRNTRHNLGFLVVEELARRWRVGLAAGECNCVVGWSDGVLLAQPQTYMNRSGHAARCLAEHHGFAPSSILVVMDDVALPLGKLRLRPSGSPGGHRGLESILESLQSDAVARLRLGVRAGELPPAGGDELVEFVLSPFAADEREVVEALVGRAADACEAWLKDGVEPAMARFNG
jgi:PTH1 family peptidyl-tRNA hydrolase